MTVANKKKHISLDFCYAPTYCSTQAGPTVPSTSSFTWCRIPVPYCMTKHGFRRRSLPLGVGVGGGRIFGNECVSLFENGLFTTPQTEEEIARFPSEAPRPIVAK